MTQGEADALESLRGRQLDGLVFCAEVYRVFENVRRSDGGISRLRLRGSNEVEKRLTEELLPIACYIQSNYRAGRYITVCWEGGSQTGDARIEQSGGYVDEGYFPATAQLEVTTACHSKEFMVRERIEKIGYAFGVSGVRRLRDGSIESEVVSYTNDEHVLEFAEIVAKAIRRKQKISYPENTTLIIACELNNLYPCDEWDELLAVVRSKKISHQFSEVLLYDHVCSRIRLTRL